MIAVTMDNVIPHPTSVAAKVDRDKARENLARQLRTNQMMRESARERINASQIIDQIGEIDARLQGTATIGTKEVVDPVTGEASIVEYEIPVPMDRDIIAALKVRADIKFKLLGKVLPDLKATESISHNVHDHSHSHLHAPVSSVEMATRIQLWQSQIKRAQPLKVINPPVPVQEVEDAQLLVDPRSEGTDVEPEYDWL